MNSATEVSKEWGRATLWPTKTVDENEPSSHLPMSDVIPSFRPEFFFDETGHLHPQFYGFEGAYQRFFVVSLSTLMAVSTFPIPPTRTPTHVLLYLKKGTAQLGIGVQRLVLHAPACLVVPVGQVLSSPAHTTNEGWMCLFSTDFLMGEQRGFLPSMLPPVLNHWMPLQWHLSAQESAHVDALMTYLQHCYEMRSSTAEAIAAVHLMGLLHEAQLQQSGAVPTVESAALRLTQAFLELLNDHWRERYTVGQYAALLHVSPSHLHKVLKASTHRSPSEWMGERLLVEAQAMLLHSAWTVGRIATELKFSGTAHFSHWFKKQASCTPSAYRHQWRE